ncbi:hypothetical protein FZEAL_7175 [Fusarium zealandicum]|uniref:Uncharacterized protein n=1 Tax=Fusarium zealandicum TaxID=1053134 RepID=A0A8H4XIQ7_9HYPO|nr:hypothetical protein FZEAL_7175 [Fusarium zealandicum]
MAIVDTSMAYLRHLPPAGSEASLAQAETLMNRQTHAGVRATNSSSRKTVPGPGLGLYLGVLGLAIGHVRCDSPTLEKPRQTLPPPKDARLTASRDDELTIGWLETNRWSMDTGLPFRKHPDTCPKTTTSPLFTSRQLQRPSFCRGHAHQASTPASASFSLAAQRTPTTPYPLTALRPAARNEDGTWSEDNITRDQ